MNQIIVITKKGKVLRAPVNTIPTQNRNGMGVGLINLKRGDEVVSATFIKEKK